MPEITAEHIFETIKSGSYKDRDEALQLIRQYGLEQSEQLRNMIIEEHLKDQEPEIIKKVKDEKLPGNY